MAIVILKQFAVKTHDLGFKDGDEIPRELISKMHSYIPLLSDARELPATVRNARDLPDDPIQFPIYENMYKEVLLTLQQYGEWLGYGFERKIGTTCVEQIGTHMCELWPKVAQMIFTGHVDGERVRAGAERISHQTPMNLLDWKEWRRCWTEDLKREGKPPFFYPCTNSQDPSPMRDFELYQRGEEQRLEFERIRNSPEHKKELEEIENAKLERARKVQARKDEGLEAALEQWATAGEYIAKHVTHFVEKTKPEYWGKHWREIDHRDGLTNGTRSILPLEPMNQYLLDREAFGDDFSRGLQLFVSGIAEPLMEKELLRRNPLPLPPEKDEGEPDAIR